jgi:hypothetical protein
MDRHAHGEHTFIIRNVGDQSLTLKTGETTCKCTQFKAADDRVEPGQTAEVKLEWDAKTTDAEFEQSAELITNDPRNNPIRLQVHGKIRDTLRPDRWDVHFSNASVNEATKAVVNIYAYRGEELKVESHDWTSGEQANWFNVSFEPLSAAELAKEPGATCGLAMTVELKAGLPIGRIDQSIRVVTNLNAQTPLTIRILGDIASDISLIAPATPEKLLVELPAFTRAEGCRQTVQLMVKGPYRDQTELKLVSVEPAAEFSATLGEPNRDNPKRVRYPLVIEVPPNATPVSRAAAGAYAKINLTTTHPDVKELTIKVRYVVPE